MRLNEILLEYYVDLSGYGFWYNPTNKNFHKVKPYKHHDYLLSHPADFDVEKFTKSRKKDFKIVFDKGWVRLVNDMGIVELQGNAKPIYNTLKLLRQQLQDSELMVDVEDMKFKYPKDPSYATTLSELQELIT